MVDHDRCEIMDDGIALQLCVEQKLMVTISAAVFLTLRVRAIISTTRMHERQAPIAAVKISLPAGIVSGSASVEEMSSW